LGFTDDNDGNDDSDKSRVWNITKTNGASILGIYQEYENDVIKALMRRSDWM